MPELSRRAFLELAGLAGAGFLGGCADNAHTGGVSDFPLLVFSDVHFQPFLAPLPPNAPLSTMLAANIALTAQLDAADISHWPAIFEGAANAANSALSGPGADTNYALFSLALASIGQNLGGSPAVLFTGDFLGHGIAQLYPAYSVNKSAAAAAAFVDKTLAFVLQQIRAAVGSLPVYFALGNCDSYTGNGPDSVFLANNAQQLSTLALPGAGDRQAILSSLTRGGYYAIEPEGMQVTILALNTILLTPSAPADPDLIVEQFLWFDAQLARASAAGRRVWLLMHAPPGADERTTGAPSNDNGQITTATMMWTAQSQTAFLGILKKYPGLIAFSLAGHTHMDEFRLMTPGHALVISAGVSPVFGNNSAYKIFTLHGSTLSPVDYTAVNCNLLTAPSRFQSYYTFSQAYNVEGPLDASMTGLFPTLLVSGAAQRQYQAAFYSGNTAACPITRVNWPVYWCGIGFMDQTEFFAAVNAFQ